MPSYSGVWTLTAQYQAKGAGNWPLPPLVGDIGLFGGGGTNVIQYVTITSTGNSTDFGDLTVSRAYTAACALAADLQVMLWITSLLLLLVMRQILVIY